MKQFFRKYFYLPITWLLFGRTVPYAKFDEYDRELTKIAKSMFDHGHAYVRINGVLCLMEKIDPKGGMGQKNIRISVVDEKSGNA